MCSRGRRCRSAKRDPWFPVSTAIREGLNYWRYLTPAFANAPKLRERGRRQAPPPVVWLSDLPLLRSRAGIRALTGIFRYLERAIPGARRRARAVRPLESRTCCWSRRSCTSGRGRWTTCAPLRRRGIASVLGVGSWDHLTTKGLIHELPDRIVVWNELQRTEAAELHGARPDRCGHRRAGLRPLVRDDGRPPTREEFCARVGLPADRPYLLYLCSSPFIAPFEVDVVRRWIAGHPRQRRRRCGPAGILVRPHPQNAAQWAGVDLSSFGDVSIWPRAGANPIGPRRAQRVLRLDVPRARGRRREHQRADRVGNRRPAGVFVPRAGARRHAGRHAALPAPADTAACCGWRTSLDEHVAQLAASFASAEHDRARVRDFIQMFVRPHGFDQPAALHVVQAVEDEAGSPSRTAPAAARPAAGAGAALAGRLRWRGAADGRPAHERRGAGVAGQVGSAALAGHGPFGPAAAADAAAAGARDP